MSEPDESAAVLPIREGLELVCDVQREAVNYFIDRLAAFGTAGMLGVCFTIHDANGVCRAFSYAAPRCFPTP